MISTVSIVDKSTEIVGLVADRLADPVAVAEVASHPDNWDPIYDALMWGPLTLSNGLPGVALLYAELARSDQRWLAIAHRHIQAAGEAMTTQPSRGLHAGPAALLAATQTCGGQYPGLRRNLAAWVAADQLTRLEACRAHGDSGVSWETYDVINGLSGTARLLLDAVEDPAETGPDVERALDGTLRHLVTVTRPIEADGHRVPGWWVPPQLQVSDRDRADYPRGDFNLGLAHGIPGPLMVLSLALRRGHDVPGLRDAIRRIAEWLMGWIRTDEHGTYWPCRVSFAEEIAETRPDGLFTRTAWCYGAPGVASALHHAGATLDVLSWRTAAVQALRDALSRDENRWAISGPTICHGYAGLLQVLHRVGSAEDDAELLDGRDRLARKVLDHADPDAPFVFRHLMRYPRTAPGPTEFKALDVAGVLEGAAGVACALLSVTDQPGEQRSWDRCLALS
ncbi:lanthionine synthetase C family protein [Amycolatopsis sp. NPDC059027]|uniref:lanthionine synthetase C family protein n=1 Tax=unclassified Amycolatopsis TaxID=2618356 RepID=UPI003671F9D3